MSKIIVKRSGTTRHQLANPHGARTLNARLVRKGATDLRNNYRIEDLGAGYHRIQPLDSNKRY